MDVRTDFEPIRLCFEEGKREVVITPEDQDRFMTTVNAVIEACKAQEDEKRFCFQFMSLLRDPLARWIKEHADAIHSAYLTIREPGILFLVALRPEKANDSDLEDSLTELDVSVANDPNYDLVSMSVFSLPYVNEESLLQFLNPKLALRHARR